MPVIAVASQKGGSGKTTLATSLTDALELAGERALLADADPQRSALMWAENAEPSQAHAVLGVGASMISHRQIPSLLAAYGWIIIDCPPRLGDTTAAALAVADLVLVPVRPSAMDLAVLPATLSALAAAREVRPTLLARAVISQRPPRSIAADQAPGAIRAAGLEVCESELGFRADYADAYAVGLGVCSFSPKSRAATEIQGLLVEIRAMLAPSNPSKSAPRTTKKKK